MKKQLQTVTIANELRSGSVFFSRNSAKTNVPKTIKKQTNNDQTQAAKEALSPTPKTQSKNQNRKRARPVDQPSRSGQSTKVVYRSNRSNKSTGRVDRPGRSSESIGLVDQTTNQLDGEIMRRPSAFYIPKAVNQKITRAVAYYRRRYHKAIDRSIVVSALLGEPKIWEKPNLDQVAKRVLHQLKNRELQRLDNRLNQSTGSVN